MSTCERCGESVSGESFDLMDFCWSCGKNLCDKCMSLGCCGSVPALSGMEGDAELGL